MNNEMRTSDYIYQRKVTTSTVVQIVDITKRLPIYNKDEARPPSEITFLRQIKISETH